MRRSATYLFTLAENLLEYGRGEAGGGLLNPIDVDLATLVADMRMPHWRDAMQGCGSGSIDSCCCRRRASTSLRIGAVSRSALCIFVVRRVRWTLQRCAGSSRTTSG